MRPTLLRVFSFAMMILILGCNSSNRREEEEAKLAQEAKAKQDQEHRAAITSIFQQRLEARKKSLHIFRDLFNNPHTNFVGQTYLRELHKIDTAPCPKEFRLAWLDYVQSWERFSTSDDLGARVEYAVGAAGRSGEAVTDSMKRLDGFNTTEAFRKVVRVALEFDVTAPQDPF